MKFKNSWIYSIIFFLVTAFLGARAIFAADSANLKIAFVDLQHALQSVEKGKKARTSLEKEFNDKKKLLEAEEKAIQKMGEEFKKQSMVLSEEAKNRKQAELQERLLKFRELYGKSQMDIQTRERELTEPIVKQLREVVQEIGKKKGYMMILEKNENGVLFSTSQDDLTDEVVKTFNKKNG
ncbi:MAG: OmpH family outer membrane protein [Bacteriovoracia bacterium]